MSAASHRMSRVGEGLGLGCAGLTLDLRVLAAGVGQAVCVCVCVCVVVVGGEVSVLSNRKLKELEQAERKKDDGARISDVLQHSVVACAMRE